MWYAEGVHVVIVAHENDSATLINVLMIKIKFDTFKIYSIFFT